MGAKDRYYSQGFGNSNKCNLALIGDLNPGIDLIAGDLASLIG
jgi:hypothetical protein